MCYTIGDLLVIVLAIGLLIFWVLTFWKMWMP
jgi:hypothetical protein